jgi:hypothetical protein
VQRPNHFAGKLEPLAKRRGVRLRQLSNLPGRGLKEAENLQDLAPSGDALTRLLKAVPARFGGAAFRIFPLPAGMRNLPFPTPDLGPSLTFQVGRCDLRGGVFQIPHGAVHGRDELVALGLASLPRPRGKGAGGKS